jgi:hypothetical protein
VQDLLPGPPGARPLFGNTLTTDSLISGILAGATATDLDPRRVRPWPDKERPTLMTEARVGERPLACMRYIPSRGQGRGRIFHGALGWQGKRGSWIERGGIDRVVDAPPLAVIRSRACGSGLAHQLSHPQ